MTDPASGETTPSLMSFNECTTLFHETGHGLQHMLTQVDEGAVAGISGVEWDAVEQPSQFMEYWVLEAQTLQSMARHWRTGEPIPQELVDKIRAAKTYRAASAMVRPLTFAMTDLAIHSAAFEPAAGAASETYRQVALRTTPTAPLPEDRFLNGFAHIFAGGCAEPTVEPMAPCACLLPYSLCPAPSPLRSLIGRLGVCVRLTRLQTLQATFRTR